MRVATEFSVNKDLYIVKAIPLTHRPGALPLDPAGALPPDPGVRAPVLTMFPLHNLGAARAIATWRGAYDEGSCTVCVSADAPLHSSICVDSRYSLYFSIFSLFLCFYRS